MAYFCYVLLTNYNDLPHAGRMSVPKNHQGSDNDIIGKISKSYDHVTTLDIRTLTLPLISLF